MYLDFAKQHLNVIMVHFRVDPCRDQFVSVVADVETPRKLLEVERDFDACIKIALSVEVASKESVSFKSSSAGVNFYLTKISLIVLKSTRVKDRINFLMFVAIAIKRIILQKFASNVFGKRNPKVINLLVITCLMCRELLHLY